MPFGIGFIFLLMLVGGVAAYWGDRVGMLVGRRRLSVFGLRPKHTSRVVAIGTGVLIVLFTLTTMLIVSNSVRIALFGIDELQAKVAYLSGEVATFEHRRETLESRNDELMELNARLESETAQLVAEKIALESEIEFLLEEVAAFRGFGEQVYNVANVLYGVAQNLWGASFHVRTGEVLDILLVDVSADPNEVLANLQTALAAVDQRLVDLGLGENGSSGALRLDRIYQTDDGQVIAFTESEVLEQAIMPLLQAAQQGYESVIIQLEAVTNARLGDPVFADFTRFVPNVVLFRAGEVVRERLFDPTLPKPELFEEFLGFVGAEVAEVARALLLPPDGEYGEISPALLYDTVDRIARYDEPVQVRAVAASDIWAYGSFDVKFEIIPLRGASPNA